MLRQVNCHEFSFPENRQNERPRDGRVNVPVRPHGSEKKKAPEGDKILLHEDHDSTNTIKYCTNFNANASDKDAMENDLSKLPSEILENICQRLDDNKSWLGSLYLSCKSLNENAVVFTNCLPFILKKTTSKTSSEEEEDSRHMQLAAIVEKSSKLPLRYKLHAANIFAKIHYALSPRQFEYILLKLAPDVEHKPTPLEQFHLISNKLTMLRKTRGKSPEDSGEDLVTQTIKELKTLSIHGESSELTTYDGQQKRVYFDRHVYLLGKAISAINGLPMDKKLVPSLEALDLLKTLPTYALPAFLDNALEMSRPFPIEQQPIFHVSQKLLWKRIIHEIDGSSGNAQSIFDSSFFFLQSIFRLPPTMIVDEFHSYVSELKHLDDRYLCKVVTKSRNFVHQLPTDNRLEAGKRLLEVLTHRDIPKNYRAIYSTATLINVLDVKDKLAGALLFSKFVPLMEDDLATKKSKTLYDYLLQFPQNKQVRKYNGIISHYHQRVEKLGATIKLSSYPDDDVKLQNIPAP